jgi:hypothetical protein
MWILNKRNNQYLKAAQMNIGIYRIGPPKEYRYKEEFQVQNTVEDIYDYQENWKNMQKEHRDKLLKLTLYYKPNGKRNRGRPRKRWKDQFLDECRWNRLYKPSSLRRRVLYYQSIGGQGKNNRCLVDACDKL